MHDPADRAWGLALVQHDRGDEPGARQALADFVAQAAYEYYKLAAVYARERQSAAAFAALERAFETRDPELDDILIDPLLAHRRNDARYAALLGRLGFSGPAGTARSATAP